MSTNIDNAEYVGEGRLKIVRKVAVRLREQYEDSDLPEGNFLDNIRPGITDEEDEQEVTIEEFDWSGCGSGYCYDSLPKILAKTTGKAQLVFFWEGGNGMSGLEVDNGKVTKKKVKVTLE